MIPEKEDITFLEILKTLGYERMLVSQNGFAGGPYMGYKRYKHWDRWKVFNLYDYGIGGDNLLKQAIQFLKNSKGPTFLDIHLMDGHFPYLHKLIDKTMLEKFSQMRLSKGGQILIDNGS